MKYKYARGFENYRWKPVYDKSKKSDYKYRHTKIFPLKLTAEVIEKGSSYNDPDKLLFKINREGNGIRKEFLVKQEIERSFEDIFKELLQDKENIKIIFSKIFIN